MTTTRQRWTAGDNDLLVEAYEQWPPRYELFPGRTRGSIHARACRLGLTHRQMIPLAFTGHTDTEWAYFAGLLDGEGTIQLQPRQSARDAYVRPVVSVCNTHLPVMEWVHQGWPHGYWRKDASPVRKKPIYSVRWTRMAVAREILQGCLPYLIIKKPNAEQVIRLVDERLGILLTPGTMRQSVSR